MFEAKLLVFVSICAGVNSYTAHDPLVVQTSFGPVKGYQFLSSWTQKTVYAFNGIPYAAPPVGDLRFRDPVSPEKWKSVKLCTQDPNSCLQRALFNTFNFTFNMSEDCLYLNVYSPNLMCKKGEFPVMVWFHGGGFQEGSGSRFRYGPDVLVAEGVVVVTVNFRLGALGFLSLGTGQIPGNAGLKDQRLALQWVQNEIFNFGGDPGRVTIFGESVGSSSVHLHYLSPLSKGLFHRAIGQSGTALGWSFRADGTAYGQKLTEILGCNKTLDINYQASCLRDVPAEAILQAQFLVKPTARDLQAGEGLLFIPCNDRHVSPEPILPDSPEGLMRAGEGSSVPFMMGINKDDGMIVLTLQSDEVMKQLPESTKYLINEEVRSRTSQSRLRKLAERIKFFYFKGPMNNSEFVKACIKLYTDTYFSYQISQCAKVFRKRNDVYLYYFTYQGKFKEKMFQDIEEKYNISGVAHGEELNYLFVREKIPQNGSFFSKEVTTWRRMARMWTNFAKFGRPTVGSDPLLQDVTWNPVDKTSTRYLQIGEQLVMVSSDLLGPSVALWDSVVPMSGYLNISYAHNN